MVLRICMKGCEGVDLGRKRLFLLDLDGTVYLEETLLPGAAAFLSCVRRGLSLIHI